MNKEKKPHKKPLIGFFPLFYNLAETGRAILVAKRYVEQGGKVVFFSHGGEYEKLAKENGFKIVRINPTYTKEFIDDLWKYSRLEKRGAPFSYEVLKEHVENEIKAFKKTDVKLIITTNNFPCSISARAAKIPLISITPYVANKFSYFPDDANILIANLIPNSIKLPILNYFYPKVRTWSHPFSKLSKTYKNTPNFKNPSDINKGDYNFFTDFLELLNLQKSEINSNDFFIGPIFLDELFKKNKSEKELDSEILKQLEKPGKSILVTFGSSGTKEFYLKILDTLNKTDYNVIAIYSSILSEKDLPKLKDNILLRKFVPSIKDLHQKADLTIMHGGQGTVYTAAYAGKPVIGIPMQFEQHQNLEMLVKNGSAIIESRRYFTEKKLIKSIKKIFDNYDLYLKKAQLLAEKLPKPNGDQNAMKTTLKILEKQGLIESDKER